MRPKYVYVAVILLVALATCAFAPSVFLGRMHPDTVSSATMAPPTITSIFPTSGQVGTTVTVTGTVYGNTQETSKVSFNGNDVTSYVSWTNNEIKCRVPAGAASGPVTVTTPGGTSNGVGFTVTEPAPPPVPPAIMNPTWYLAEGTTAWGFETYISIQNPNPLAVNADITYMTPTGEVIGPSVALPARSQATVFPRETLGEKDFSTKVVCREGATIAVDRTMSWTGAGASSPEAHSSVGVTEPAILWYLPEGSSNWGFETFLLIQNPGSVPANCEVTYMIEGEGPREFTKVVPAASRATYNMAVDIGAKDASIKVASDEPVIPERAMYRNDRREGHDSIGATSPAQTYYLAEGTTGWGFTTFVLIQNPNESPVDVTVTYMTPSGAKEQPAFQMPASSRKTIKVNGVLPDTDLSTRVYGSAPIIAERAMYWDHGTGEACHDSIGMSAAHQTFYLPDGQVSEGRETFTLIQNPNDTDVTVEITYMGPTGTENQTFSEVIPANSRKTYSMGQTGGTGREAILVRSLTIGKKVMVERAMYWNNRGAGTDTIGGYSD